MRENESGFTLVEVLATLTLLSMVVTLVWTAFFISTKYNIAETSKLQLQQEANYIITKIQQQHRQKECYKLEIKEDKVKLVNCNERPEFIEEISSDFKYEPYISEEIEPKYEDLYFNLIVKDTKENSNLKVAIKTIITRYKSEN